MLTRKYFPALQQSKIVTESAESGVRFYTLESKEVQVSHEQSREFILLINEPRCEKTGLQGFRPGTTQTGLYSYSLKFRIYEVEGLYYPCNENKGADQLRVTAQLICVLVFAYAKSWFSHDAAQM